MARRYDTRGHVKTRFTGTRYPPISGQGVRESSRVATSAVAGIGALPSILIDEALGRGSDESSGYGLELVQHGAFAANVSGDNSQAA